MAKLRIGEKCVNEECALHVQSYQTGSGVHMAPTAVRALCNETHHKSCKPGARMSNRAHTI